MKLFLLAPPILKWKVSIPERVLEALKHTILNVLAPILVEVSIPERVLEALKLRDQGGGRVGQAFQSLKGF